MIASCSDLTSDKLLLLITMILHLLLEIPFVQQLLSCVLRIRWQGAITTLPLRNQDVHFSFESSVTWTQPNPTQRYRNDGKDEWPIHVSAIDSSWCF
jgi:hypothetical protein